jgi:cobalt-zinc-cadmium efflux system membrane fusion protein
MQSEPKENDMNEQNSVSTLEPAAEAPSSKGAHATAPTSLRTPQPESWLVWLKRCGPMVLVLALLGSFAYGGHRMGWTVPKFAELFGASSAAKDDWCEAHSVPESICVECNESLLPKLETTWCRRHGIHNCPFERPEVAQILTTAVISQADLDRAQRALNLKDRKENNSKCKLHERRIQFASLDIINKMGIEYSWPVSRESIYETVSASGEIMFDQPRVAPVSVPVAGRVWHMSEKATTGSHVNRGDVLALLDAVEVGKGKAEFLQAYAQTELRKKTLDRLTELMSQGAASLARITEAETALQEARIRLMAARQTLGNMGLPFQVDESKGPSTEEVAKQIHFLGIPAEIASRLNPKTTTANLMPVIASRDGIVTAAKVSLGEMADAGKPLFVVSDTSHMWLMMNVRQEDVRYLRIRDWKASTPGQKVKFRADGSDDEIVGELVWKRTEVDEKTRTVQFRAELPNPDGKLLAHSYGTGQIVLREEKDAIVVPNEAIHWDNNCHVVFVRDKGFLDPNGFKVFHARSVRPGVTNGRYTEIIAGVLPGEIIATTNSASLRAELLKNNLGAG